MPVFEEVASHRYSTQTMAQYSYDKILAFCSQNSNDGSVLTRTNKIKVALKDSAGYYNAMKSFTSGMYGDSVAGCDLSALLMPFQTKINPSGALPGFFSGVNPNWQYPSGNVDLVSLFPLGWDASKTGLIYDRYQSPSGDSLGSIPSSPFTHGDLDRFRDITNMRGIALRGPIVMAAWGYTLGNGTCFPSGSQSPQDSTIYPSGTTFFKNSQTDGRSLDPSDYVVAPIDFRYDLDRNVWVTPTKIPAGQGRFKVLQLSDDTYFDGTNFSHVLFDFPRFHTSTS